MGSSSSKSEGWQPATADTPRRISKAGYDVTPMTAEQRAAAAAKLTDFQRYVTLKVCVGWVGRDAGRRGSDLQCAG
jgi:hypothetical protein